MDVPPEWTEVAIPLVTMQAPQIADVSYDGSITVTFSQYMDIASVSADNVKLQCGGTAVPVTVTPVNAEESGTDSTVFYASVFRIEPQTAITGEANVQIDNVKNYAGIALEQAYTCTVGTAQRVPGDVDGDGQITLKDAALIQRHIVGGWNVTIDLDAADVNDDGYVTLIDAALIQRVIVGGWGVTLR